MTKYLVFGHQNPDTDAIGSAIGLAYYLEQIGHEAEAVAFGEPNDETKFALEKFGFKAPRVVETVSNEVEAVALVDHNEPAQSAPDIKDVRVDYVVDNHRIAGFETADQVYFRSEPVGCTATVLYKMFKEKDIEIPDNLAGLLASCIISDTLLFNSPITTDEDIEITNALTKKAGVDTKEYGMALLRAGADLSKRTASDIFNSDAKSFTMADKSVRIGQVNVVDFDDFAPFKDEVLEVMNDVKAEDGFDTVLLVVTNILENDSFGLVIGESLDIVEKAFDGEIKDNEIELLNVVSRKKQVVPPLTKAFEDAN